MQEETTAETALPVLLTTQLMAAEVYARFLIMGGEDEKELWRDMLAEEVDHVVYLRDAMTGALPDDLTLPFANADRLNGVCERAKLQGMDSFILRLEGALRLECAELDFGLEGLAAKRFAKRNNGIRYPGDLAKHLDGLLFQARRYQASPNISRQISRLEELYDASVSGTTTIMRELRHP